RHRLVHDLSRARERGIEERFIGLELLPGIDRAAGCRNRKQEENAGERSPEPVAPPACLLGAPQDLVESHPQKRRDDLLLGDLLAVTRRPRVSRNRLLALIRDPSVGANLMAQRGRKAFAQGIAGLADDDDRDHARGAAQHLEPAHLLVDVFALRRIGRADNDQKLRRFERGEGVVVERVPGRKILAIAEDRAQRFWDRPRPCRAAGEVLFDAIAFESGVQPLGPRLVAMAVAQEGAIFERDRLAHTRSFGGRHFSRRRKRGIGYGKPAFARPATMRAKSSGSLYGSTRARCVIENSGLTLSSSAQVIRASSSRPR